MELKYIGNGDALPGVPARDLSKDDVISSGYAPAELIATGLYAPVNDKAGTARKEK